MLKAKMDEIQASLSDLKSSNPEIRELALDTIGTLNPKGAFEIILPFLSDPDVEVRGTAACNLGDISDCRAIQPLIDVIRNEYDERVRSEALSALENYSDSRILRCLIDEANREKRSRRPRQIVARQLSNYSSEESVDALIKLLNDNDVYVRIFAVDSLFKLNRPRLYKIWEKMLLDESNYVSDIAEQAISQLD